MVMISPKEESCAGTLRYNREREGFVRTSLANSIVEFGVATIQAFSFIMFCLSSRTSVMNCIYHLFSAARCYYKFVMSIRWAD